MEPLLTWILHGAHDGRPDADLIATFLATHDERAFAEVVRRHGPVVWGVCRRMLPDLTDAEDAFQATFVVLIRRGYQLAAPLGPWLYRVAVLTARGVRRRNARRLAHRRPLLTDVVAPPTPASFELDGLLLRMPEKYRSAVLLCCVEGLTEREAASRIGCPVGTLSARLSRGLAWLRGRLGQDPQAILALAAATVGVVPAMTTAAAVRTAVVMQAASQAVGTAPATVVQLATEVSRSMSMTNVRLGLFILPATLLLSAAGVLALARPSDPGVDRPKVRVIEPAIPLEPASRNRAEPSRPEPAEDPPGTVGPSRPGEPVWKAEFRKTYGLANGQAVKFIRGDPFPGCREAYLIAEPSPYPKPRHEKLLVVFTSDGKRIRHRNVVIDAYGWVDEQTPQGVRKRLRGRRLWEMLSDGLRIAPPLLEVDPELAATELYADIVFRENASLDQIAKSLQAELQDKFQIVATVTAREEERVVAIAQGKYAHRFREGRINGEVSVAGKDLDPDDVRGTYGVYGSGDSAGLFRRLGESVGMPVIDETDQTSWKLVIPKGKESEIGSWTGMRGYRYPRRTSEDVRPVDGTAERAAILKHVADQTGVTFKTEKRKVWILSIKKAEK